MEQRTEEWQAARLGALTGTRADVVLNGTAKAQNTLLAEVVTEFIMMEAKEFIPNKHVIKGRDDEPVALAYYELEHNCLCVSGGFVVSKRHPLIAVSPDARIGINQGGVEVKNPATFTHVHTLITGQVDRKYEAQIDWALMIFGCEWWDYFSYCKEMPPHLQSFTKRYYAKDRDIDKKWVKALEFADRVENTLKDMDLWID